MIEQTIIFLIAAVIAVPLFKKLGLGAVLGYLAAGIAIGPWGLDLAHDVDEVLHLAELGVVLLLFIIGLELQPSRLWALRRSVFGLGAAQLVITGAVLAAVSIVFRLPWASGVLIGLILALSSTAFALQTLAESNELVTRYGRMAFAVLLFQDLAVVPLLAIVPLLGGDAMEAGESLWLSVVRAVAILASIVIAGRFLLRYLLRLVARTGVREILTATALLTVIGTAYLAQWAGLSMALGAFLAGVLLADSEFRHQLEADIEPFKGLLLGLFFIAVGMSVNLGLLASGPLTIIGAVAALIVAKVVVLFTLGRIRGLTTAAARRLALVISQGGEFAFVLFGVAVPAGVLGSPIVDRLTVIVTLSMAATPLLLAADNWFIHRSTRHSEAQYDVLPDEDNQVIIAGFGRFGQIIARILRAKKIGFTALEISQEQVDFVRKYGSKIFYGDASRLDLLQAAHADKAKLFVLAIDEVDASLRAAKIVREQFPNMTIYARARNRHHAYELMELGIKIIRRETFFSALDMAGQVLQGLGLSEFEADRALQRFTEHDLKRLHAHRHLHDDEEKLQALAKEGMKELEELFEQDVGD